MAAASSRRFRSAARCRSHSERSRRYSDAGETPAENPALFAGQELTGILHAAIFGPLAPWPDLCANCAFFRPHEPFADPLAQKQIRKLQIEPSLECRLRCPGCSNQYQVKVRPLPLQMDLGLYDRLLRALRDEGYRVDEIEYCGQGEPLLHAKFPRFVQMARTCFPTTVQRLITSGNFDYHAANGDERLDEIMVSCDGVDAQSYQRYRVGGRVEEAIGFMRDATRVRPPQRARVVWKYILFEWNDTPDEIFRAQSLAQELGVDAMHFVYTHSQGKSQRYTLENPEEFPLHFSNVVTNATPIHYQHGAQPAPLS